MKKEYKYNKLGVLCPSRFRPKRLEVALQSYVDNAKNSDIFFAFQQDDPNLPENIEVINKFGFKDYLVTGNVGLCAKVNELQANHKGYMAYMILNDDQIICTPEFDKKLLAKLDELYKEHGHRYWILHWRDGIQDKQLCQSFATHEMLEILGSYYPEGYMKQLYSDNWYHTLGVNCNILVYMPDIFIEHIHWCVGKAPMDYNYFWTNTQDNYRLEKRELMRFLQEKGMNLINKVNQAINCNKNS